MIREPAALILVNEKVWTSRTRERTFQFMRRYAEPPSTKDVNQSRVCMRGIVEQEHGGDG